jgi:hypothetical protein
VQLHVAAAVVEQLRVVVVVVVEQFRALALFSGQLRVAALVWVQLRAVALTSEQLHVVVAVVVQLRALAALSERSRFAALWYVALSYAVRSLCELCSHVLAVSFQRIAVYPPKGCLKFNRMGQE